MPAEASAGWLEVALPLWHRRWRLLLSLLLGGALGLGLALPQTPRYTGQASFVVQPSLRPGSQAVAGALPALAGLMGAGGGSQTDLHVAILRSQALNDRVIDRFNLQQLWALRLRSEVHQRLARRINFGVGRREGVVQVQVQDENPQRAAAMANEYIVELRQQLRGFAQDEARQRRTFYEGQLASARKALDAAQKKLQAGGFDRAALRSEPRTAAEAYGRLQAEVAAAEMRLSATRRVRTEGSAEVQQQQAELAALRSQLSAQELPRDDSRGEYVSRMREFRYAETLAESLARQAEAARVDEASEPLPLQVLDAATVPDLPSSPRLPLWLLGGALLGLGLQAGWVMARHRRALRGQDAALQQRLAHIRSVLG
jgi:uncharacterized protein involved in exopolysaccharide biosynthesis